MVNADEIKKAYEDLGKASEKQYEAEEARIAAAISRDKAYVAEMNEAASDGVKDQMILQRRCEKATRKQLEALQKAEKASRKAAQCYRQAGIRVDSLVRQLEAEKLAMQAQG
jgi:IS5 family transposase